MKANLTRLRSTQNLTQTHEMHASVNIQFQSPNLAYFAQSAIISLEMMTNLRSILDRSSYCERADVAEGRRLS